MSCYEWESGTIRLPTAEYVRVRKHVQASAAAYWKKVFELTQQFWKELPSRGKSDLDFYHKCVNAFVYGAPVANDYGYDPKVPRWRGVPSGNARVGLTEDVQNALYIYNSSKPRRLLQKDVLRPTNKTLRYDCGEGSVEFHPERHSVTWSVGENNHAREYGREHPIAQAFFAVLRTVNWTRGSGGEIVGNDEYNRDSRDSGGGGNYVIDYFGPVLKNKRRRITW